MNEQNEQGQWQAIEGVWKNFSGFYELLRGSVLVTVLLVIGAYIFIEQVTDYSMNAFTEAIGVIGTALILDRVYQRRSEHERKEELIFQLGSNERITALSAARMLLHKGWLADGSVAGASLSRADLSGSLLKSANFENTRMKYTNLEGAWLKNANLKNAMLGGANLTGAVLDSANMTNTMMSFTLNDETISATLPDKTVWTESTDLGRFTDSSHPDYPETTRLVNQIRHDLGYAEIEDKLD